MIHRMFVLRELVGIQQSPSCASALAVLVVRGYSLLKWSCLLDLLYIVAAAVAKWSAFLVFYVFTFHENTRTSTYTKVVSDLRQQDHQCCVLL